MDFNTSTAPHPDEGFTSGETNSERPAGTNAASIDHLIRTIKGHLAAGQKGGLANLTTFRSIGEALLEAKEVLPKGEFGPWTEAQFGFSKGWRASLMRVADAWGDILAALHWATEQGRVLGRKEYSVDGALALLKEYKIASDPDLAAAAEEAAAEKATKAAEAKAAKETETEKLRRMLAEALNRIETLEADLSKMRGNEPPKGKAKAAEEPKVNPVTAAHKGKARKVHGLYKGGATDGEKAAAQNRLEEMAAGYSMTLGEFLAACGLEA